MPIMFWMALLVMFIGLLGTLLPVLPGTPLIFLGALGYGIFEGFQKVTPLILVVLFILVIFTFVVDYLAGVVGAKNYGASRFGTWGALIGGIVGLIVLNIPGLLLGPFVGAVAGEIIGGRKPDEALKVGFGTVVGMAGGAFVKIITAAGMIAIFIVAVV